MTPALLALLALVSTSFALDVSGAKKPPKPPEPTLATLADELRDAQPKTRRAAVKKLAQLGTKPAWALVIGALEDREGEVASDAQLELARLREPALLRELFGRAGLGSSDEVVRLRVAEAFGRIPLEIDGNALLKGVRSKPSELARTLVWSCERALAGGRLAGEREALARELEEITDARCGGDVRGAALFALRALDAKRAGSLARELVAAKEPALRCAALAACADFAEGDAVGIAQRALGDAEASVRARAIENLCQRTSRDAFVALVGHLEREPRSRLKHRMRAHLVAASREDHGFDAAAWAKWAHTVQGPNSTGGARGPVVRDTQAKLAGLGLVSDRIVFLIDLSGSVWKELADGRTRKSKIDEKLRAALEALPKETLFNVIPYTGEPFAFEKRLVPATPTNVQRALAWFEACTQSGRGDYLRAVRLALQDEDVDTVCALTDGVPTGGVQWNMDLITDGLLEANRYRCVAFDSILVDARGAKMRAWERLAAGSAGAVVAVSLDPAEEPDDSGHPKRKGR